MAYPEDPLVKYGRPLAGVLIAVVISVLVAAMIGGAMPFEYRVRAWIYTGLVLWVLVGAFVLFRLTAESERAALTPARILKWTVSLWIWPVFLLRRS